MATYTVSIYNGRRVVTPKVIVTTDIVKARKYAVLKLIENDVKGQYATLKKNGKDVAYISMEIGPEEYLKPSVGLAKGHSFLYNDGGQFMSVYTNGRLGPF